MKKNILYICLLMLITGCTKTITFSGEETSPLLVVNGFAVADSSFWLSISHSNFFLNYRYSFDYPDDAVAMLSINGGTPEQMVFGEEQCYYSSQTPRAGDVIEITVTESGFETVKGRTQVPSKPIVTSIDTTLSQFNMDYSYAFDEQGVITDTIGYWGSSTFDIDISLKDNADENNYYQLVVFSRVWSEDGTYFWDNSYFEFKNIYSDDMSSGAFEEIFDEEEYDEYKIFPDPLFNGKEIKLNASVTVNYSYRNLYTDQAVNAESSDFHYPELYVSVQALSEESYLYLKTLMTAQDDLGISLFSEPVQIYSNIEGGIGILGGYCGDIHKYTIKTGLE